MSENDSLVIIDHYNQLDDKAKAEFRDKTMRLTGMAYASFYNKMAKRTSFRQSEIIVIKSIINRNVTEH